MKNNTFIVGAMALLIASAGCQTSTTPKASPPAAQKPTQLQTTKTDEQVYAEFEAACRGAEQHKGFLLDPNSNKPLPIYIVTAEPPPKKERGGSISGKVSTGMTKPQVRQAVGWPDDYLLKISAGPDPNNLQDDIVQEAWQYGNDMLWFDRKTGRLVRIETKKKD